MPTTKPISMATFARQYDLDRPAGDYFTAGCALYWYCVNYHEGQGSDLYAIQCQLGYRPGVSENGPEPASMDQTIYQALEAGELLAADVKDWIDQQYAEMERRGL